MKTLKELIKEYPEYFPENQLGFYCGDGWVFLIEKICQRVKSSQNSWLLLVDTSNYINGKSDKPFLKFNFQQIKEKFGQLRIYADISFVEYDWEKFDEDYHIKEFSQESSKIESFISAMESMSGEICEVTGQRGRLRQSKGWMKTLSDEQAIKQGYTD